MSNPLCWNYYYMKRTLIFLIATSMIFTFVKAEFDENYFDDIKEETAVEHGDFLANNDSVKACEDFYYYSCGTWIKKNEIPNGKDDVSVLSTLEKKLTDDLSKLVKEHLRKTDADHVKMIKQTYWSCMDYKSIAEANFKPVDSKLKYLFKSMGEWEEKDYDWIDTISKLRKLGYDHNFPLLINVFFNRIEIGSPVIKIRELLSGSFVIRGFDIMQSTRALANKELMQNLTKRPSVIEHWARNVTYFEAILSVFTWSTLLPPALEIKMRTCLFKSLTPPNVERLHLYKIYSNVRMCVVMLTNRTKVHRFKRSHRANVPYNNEYTIKELQEKAPEINWLKYIRALFNDPIYDNETLLITEINPIRYVAKFMKAVRKSDIATYILWHVTLDYKATVNELSRYKKPRRECFQNIKKHMDIALSSYYITRHNKKEEKDKATEIAKYIKNAFIDILDSQNWMDKTSIEKLKKQAMAIKVLVGYPDELLDDEIISDLYKNFNTTGYYVDIHKEMKKLDIDKKFSEIREKKNNGWKDFSRATDVRPHYDSSQNTIYIPAAMLQPPYFLKERPWFINFGILGAVIGREIAYRFILEGSHLDKYMKPRWSTLVDQKYKENIRCITDQFRKFAEENDLESTILINTDQDVADSLGIQITYKAYTTWVKQHGKERKHFGIYNTPLQLVWINAARGLCGKNRQKSVRKQKKRRRYHKSYKFRVINSVANQPEFETDFKCTVGTNTQNKCQFL